MEARPLTLDDGLWQHATPSQGVPASADECVFQTSGSEGAPKHVVHTREAMRLHAQAVNTHLSITRADHWLLALPLHHVGGFSILVRALESGSRVTHLAGRWNARDFAAARNCTLASLVPAQVYDLVAARLPAPPSMRAVLVGGGVLSPEIESAALALGWPVLKTYGMTETASQVATQRSPGGDEMHILPIWSLSTDADDFLTVRGPALTKGWWAQKAEKWHFEPVLPENGLRTRDRILLTQNGKLRFLDREAGTVKILGELVSLAAIQAQIDALRLELGLHSTDAAVIDMPDARQEARLLLSTASMSEAQSHMLLCKLNERLRPFERINQHQPLPAIPRTELGKVALNSLRQSITPPRQAEHH